jgi:hypothetical protein
MSIAETYRVSIGSEETFVEVAAGRLFSFGSCSLELASRTGIEPDIEAATAINSEPRITPE